jgi:carbon monoxide dehydrogenase subunit G
MYFMPNGFAATATIERPAAEVWSVLTDWSRAGEWMSGIGEMTGETEPGATLTFRARGKNRMTKVVALEPGRTLTLRSTQGGVRADYEYTLMPLDDGRTEATLSAECVMAGTAWRLFGGIIRSAMRRADSGQMDALKHVVEAG